jgi:hypothetical protein
LIRTRVYVNEGLGKLLEKLERGTSPGATSSESAIHMQADEDTVLRTGSQVNSTVKFRDEDAYGRMSMFG